MCLNSICPRLFTHVHSFDRLGELMLEVSVPVDKPPLNVPTLPTYLPEILNQFLSYRILITILVMYLLHNFKIR